MKCVMLRLRLGSMQTLNKISFKVKSYMLPLWEQTYETICWFPVLKQPKCSFDQESQPLHNPHLPATYIIELVNSETFVILTLIYSCIVFFNMLRITLSPYCFVKTIDLLVLQQFFDSPMNMFDAIYIYKFLILKMLASD